MKTVLTLLCAGVLGFAGPLQAASDTFIDYQNYNHGYCADCECAPCSCAPENADDPCSDGNCPAPTCASQACDPCAPVCGAECGISLCAIGVGLAAVAAAAAIIVASSSGSSSSH